ncbi:hypothetical protein TVAG_282850 [Trichomonas vaginalis G3]|uniref:Uncharacterized protein n=1 Tax=Trichomonas vaginalis (strain ATCC PRA-98 / G3) TaxID=412133 RepID=A2DEI8_TRIV3|nr:hypothetical protein TVAGG3_0028200 [Trichomonas vaginalis G3]EAY21115.1 hypothetical protein TVAG_282850 [Trichomonas vaginalis G3]KAI5539946.1 hypothetical protein TVAGG3_0028200 [Trichomonas vaginalis G3]|eukprot:XP_001582101.1 hypothetical protein [Trichomonas vaginalis G3]
MDFFPPLYEQAEYIDSGISILDNILDNGGQSLKTGESKENLNSIKSQIETLKEDVNSLKDKIDSIAEFGNLVNETIKSVEQLKKFGNFLGIQFGDQQTTQYSIRDNGSVSVIISEKVKTPIKSPNIIKTSSSEPQYREITHDEYESLESMYKYLMKEDLLTRNYYTLYNSGVTEFTDELTRKYGISMFGPLPGTIWEILRFLKRSETIESDGKKIYRFR